MILCDPALSVDVLKLALPLASVPVPSSVLPSLNFTVPVGVVVAEVTVAVNFTVCPALEGFTEDTIDVFEFA